MQNMNKKFNKKIEANENFQVKLIRNVLNYSIYLKKNRNLQI